MKILFLSDEIPPESPGGAGFSTFILAKAIARTGYEVGIFAGTGDSKKHREEEVIEGVKVFYVFTNFPIKLKTYFGLYNPKVLKYLNEVLRQYKPDIIHAHNVVNRLSFYSLALARKKSRAAFFTARDTMSFTYGKYWWYKLSEKIDYKVKVRDLFKQSQKSFFPLRNLLIRKWVNGCSAIVTVSRELGEAMQQNGFQNVVAIHNAVNVQEYDMLTQKEINSFKKKHGLLNRKIVFCAGRLTGYKGFSQVIDVIDSLKNYNDYVFAFAMNEKHFKGAASNINNKKITEKMICLGWLNEDEVKIAFKSCNVVIVPSVYLDPFPRINLEAMAARRPVVGTCFGGTPEIVEDGVNGYVVNPCNTKEMAEKIKDILDNKEKQRQMGEAGYELVKKEFNTEVQVKKTIALYKKYLDKKS